MSRQLLARVGVRVWSFVDQLGPIRAYPEVDDHLRDAELERVMDLTRLVAGLGNTARKGAGVRSRQPLPALLVAGGSTFRELPDWAGALIQDELNVKRVEYVKELGEAVRQRAEANPKILGPKYGKDYPRIRTAIRLVASGRKAAPANAAKQDRS